MKVNEWFIRLLSLALFFAGIFFAFWPLAFLGALLAALCGRWILALVLALLLDLLVGAPTSSFLRMFVFPYTLLTLAIVVARSLIIRHLR